MTVLPARWTRDESAERFPNPVTPLAWDFADAGFHAALQASCVRMGWPPIPGRWFAWFDGYIYGNQTAVDLTLGRPIAGTGTLDELRASLPTLMRRFAWLDELPGEWPLTLDRFLLDVGRLHADDPAGCTPHEIWTHIGALQGIPGSPGRAAGPAYVVRSPEDFAGCPAGAILVVRATTPAWTALFARAAGIVAESGGPLSHGAIAAREHGIPAVMAVRGAMQRLANGQQLLVDGARGIVQCA